MSTKIRALLWEELRTGGVIAGWCVLVGTLCLLELRFLEGPDVPWQFMRPVVMSLSLVLLCLIVLLLLFRTGNSGILTGGFSGRILLLPIETWRAIGLTLFTRAVLVCLATIAMTVICRALFEGGPAWVMILLFPALFLAFQGLDWMRRSIPFLGVLWLCAILIGIGSLYLRYGYFTPIDLDDVPVSWLASILSLLLIGGVVFGLSIITVNLTRCGERSQRAFRFRLPEVLPLPGWLTKSGFRSPRWALLWWFLRKDGALLPLTTLAVGLFLSLGYIIAVIANVFDGDGSNYVVAGLLEWGPWIALLFGALLWGGMRGGAGIQRGVRPSLTEYLYPMSSAEMTVTRLWGQGMVLGVTWLIALLISNSAFLLGDNALAWRIYSASWAAGESSLREILRIQLTIPLLVLFAAWVLMALRTRLIACFFCIQILLWLIAGSFFGAYSNDDLRWLSFAALLGLLTVTIGGTTYWMIRRGRIRRWYGAVIAITVVVSMIQGISEDYIATVALWTPVALALTLSVGALIWTGRRNLLPLHHLIGCAVAWLLTALFLYPFGPHELSGIDRPSLLLALAAGALVVFPYPALLLDLHRRRHNDDTALAPEEHTRRTTPWNMSPALRAGSFVLFALLLFAGVWFRWPAKPAYIETLRTQGKPATLADLAESYGPLPKEENAALHYLDVMRQQSKRERTWNKWVEKQKKELSEEEAYRLYGGESDVVYGVAGADPGELVWTKTWDVARKRYAMVDQDTVAALAKIAKAHYPQSHYPIDLGSGMAVSLPHLSGLRQLARSQAFSIWMAAVEDRPEDIIPTLHTMEPLAESLRDEPILISQLVRIALHGIMVATVEQGLSRTAFTEEQLADMQNFLSTVLPPIEEHSMIAQGLVGEGVFAVNYHPLGQEFGRPNSLTTQAFGQSFLAFNRIVFLRCYAELEKNTGITETPFLQEIGASSNLRYALPKILLPAIDGVRASEWRCRVNNAMAATACAVERYRLAQGTLPEDLDALVPKFMEAVPTDPFRDDKGPISYRIREDGGYVIYSWAQNRTDDHAIAPEKGNAWSNGDWTFSVAPLAFRDGPQLTDTPPVDEEEQARQGLGSRRSGPVPDSDKNIAPAEKKKKGNTPLRRRGRRRN